MEAYNRLQEQVLDHLNLYMPKQVKEIAENPRSEDYKHINKSARILLELSISVWA